MNALSEEDLLYDKAINVCSYYFGNNVTLYINAATLDKKIIIQNKVVTTEHNNINSSAVNAKNQWYLKIFPTAEQVSLYNKNMEIFEEKYNVLTFKTTISSILSNLLPPSAMVERVHQVYNQ